MLGRVIRTAGCLTGIVAILLLLGCNPGSPSGRHSVTIVPATNTLKVGQTVEFGLSEHYPPGVTPLPTSYEWSIDNPNVASIEGFFSVSVTGKSEGRARLTGCVSSLNSGTCDSRVLTVVP
jgi:hypothetical protein